MRPVVLATKGKDMFVTKQLPNLMINFIAEGLRKPALRPLVSYMQTAYGVSQNEFIKLLKENILTTNIDQNRVAIRFYDAQIKKGDQVIYLNMLIDLINYGNRTVRGSYIINKAVDEVLKNIGSLKLLAFFRKDLHIWQ